MAQKRLNVIVFFTDQQRWDTTGVHGNAPGHRLTLQSIWTINLSAG